MPIILGAVISQRVVGFKKIFISANPFPVEFSFVNHKLFLGTEPTNIKGICEKVKHSWGQELRLCQPQNSLSY